MKCRRKCASRRVVPTPARARHRPPIVGRSGELVDRSRAQIGPIGWTRSWIPEPGLWFQ